MAVFNVDNPVYMVSADNTNGWVAGKVYRARIESKNGDNLNIRFEADRSQMTINPEQLQNINLNTTPPIMGLNQATLLTAFNLQQGKTPDTYLQLLRDAQHSQSLDTRNTANMLLGLNGGRRSRRKSRRRRRSRRYKK